MNVLRYTTQEWQLVAEVMHLSVFNEHRPKELNRIDFALVAWNGDVPVGYITCMEYDSKSVYIGFGGIMAQHRNSFKSLAAYKMGLDYLKDRYSRVNTLIENDNFVMLKMAMTVGFRITGIRYFNGSIMLENSIEWGI